MSRTEKLIQKIFLRQQVSYQEIEKILLGLGYELKIKGSHHVFRKAGHKHISLKIRSQLLPYQYIDVEEALKNHGYEKTI